MMATTSITISIDSDGLAINGCPLGTRFPISAITRILGPHDTIGSIGGWTSIRNPAYTWIGLMFRSLLGALPKDARVTRQFMWLWHSPQYSFVAHAGDSRTPREESDPIVSQIGFALARFDISDPDKGVYFSVPLTVNGKTYHGRSSLPQLFSDLTSNPTAICINHTIHDSGSTWSGWIADSNGSPCFRIQLDRFSMHWSSDSSRDSSEYLARTECYEKLILQFQKIPSVELPPSSSSWSSANETTTATQQHLMLEVSPAFNWPVPRTRYRITSTAVSVDYGYLWKDSQTVLLKDIRRTELSNHNMLIGTADINLFMFGGEEGVVRLKRLKDAKRIKNLIDELRTNS